NHGIYYYYCYYYHVFSSLNNIDAWTKFNRSESTTNILKQKNLILITYVLTKDVKCCKQLLPMEVGMLCGKKHQDLLWTLTIILITKPMIIFVESDGSAPNLVIIAYDDNGNAYAQKTFNTQVSNLVIIAYDDNGNAYAQKTFNTQVCEQLNAWLGGFESILKCMTPGNFNWFLYTILFYHTKYVIAKQKRKAESSDSDDENEELGLDEETSDSSEAETSDSDSD
ncbi:hypothetical protein CVT25_005227, partial [Psilocybe cyanescens]